MGRKLCFLCNNDDKEGLHSFHKFPKNPNIRSAWFRFCNLDEGVDNVSNIYICSQHFTSTDYIEPKAKELGSKMKLKPNSIPSILKPQNSVQGQSLGELNLEPTEMPSSSSSTQGQIVATPRATPKKRKFGEPRYVGEIGSAHLATPRRAKRCIHLAKRTISQQGEKIRKLQRRNRSLIKKIRSLEELVDHLKKKNLISENGGDSMVMNLPESMKELISRRLQKRNRHYSPELRKFALTLQFYSTAAYNYVRKTWQNLLPHPSTLRKWYSVVDGKPGFSKEAFSALSARNKSSPVYMNIVLDEMSIRSQIIYDSGGFYGGVNMGTNLSQESDTFREATNALVFMGVGLNGHWKVPLGYFLIDGLSGRERANLLIKCLELVKESDIKVFSVTFDGAPVNLAMCTCLGANFDYYHTNFKPWFKNPVTGENIWIFLDACHMLKLVRNTLGDKKILSDSNGQIIKWAFLENLYELQHTEGLHAGTKLSKKHIYYQDNRMNVKLAAQTLSESVYNAFKFVDVLKIPKFEDCMPTAEFCLIFNNIFDILNCKNKFSKRNVFNIPIDDNNLHFLLENAVKFENYIVGLKDHSGTLILKSNRKTGFLGLIICLRNVFHLYRALQELGQNYLLSYKLSQDYIETFFSCIRSRGGFNNNPNAKQFEAAFKRLLVRHEISNTYNSNCLADGVEILHVSSQKKNFTDPIIDDQELNWDLFDHDYMSTLWTLTPYVENIVTYISGFVVKKILKSKSLCTICAKQLIAKSDSAALLIKIKNRGKFIFPSEEVCKICIVAERVFRQNLHILFTKKNIKQFLILNIFKNIDKPFYSKEMEEHILSHDILDNHRSQLTKLIIESFLTVRLFHEAKTRSEKGESIRQKYTKLILFKNQ